MSGRDSHCASLIMLLGGRSIQEMTGNVQFHKHPRERGEPTRQEGEEETHAAHPSINWTNTTFSFSVNFTVNRFINTDIWTFCHAQIRRIHD